MSDRVDLRLLDRVLVDAARACNDLEGVLRADRIQKPRSEELRRLDLMDDLWRIQNLVKNVRGGIRHLGGAVIETTDATSHDVAPETTEAGGDRD